MADRTESRNGDFSIHKGLCVSPTECRTAGKCLGPCESRNDDPLDESMERSLIRRLTSYVETSAANPKHWGECRLRYEAIAYLDNASAESETRTPEEGRSSLAGALAEGTSIRSPATQTQGAPLLAAGDSETAPHMDTV